MKWISVKDGLPLTQYEESVRDQFLVTVELNEPDPNDERQVMFLWFDNVKNIWLDGPIGQIYEDCFLWHVTHWAEKPAPAEG